MRQVTRYLRGLACAGALALAGCGSATRLTKVWTDPAFATNSLRHLMVIGIARNATDRRVFEDSFTAALRAQGIEAEPSYPLVADGNLDSARLGSDMHRTGCDGVFVTRIVDQTTVRTYYPPTAGHLGGPWAAPWQYRGGWYGYYSLGYSYVGAPGYTVENQVVNFETNLYRVADGQLVWSALSREWLEVSETPGPEVEPFVRQLMSALLDSKIVTRPR
jgi:hypothetical protein